MLEFLDFSPELLTISKLQLMDKSSLSGRPKTYMSEAMRQSETEIEWDEDTETEG